MFSFLTPHSKSESEQMKLFSIFSKDPQDCGLEEVENLKSLLSAVPQDSLPSVLSDVVTSLLIFCDYGQDDYAESTFLLFFDMLVQDYGYSTPIKLIYDLINLIDFPYYEDDLTERYQSFSKVVEQINDIYLVLAAKRVFLNHVFGSSYFFKNREIIKELSSALLENSQILEEITTISTNLGVLNIDRTEE